MENTRYEKFAMKKSAMKRYRACLNRVFFGG